MNALGDLGATHIFIFNLGKQRPDKSTPEYSELISAVGDIRLNPKLYSYPANFLEHSLLTYLSVIYIEYPPWVKINLNGAPVPLINPYSSLKYMYNQFFTGEKQEKFAI
jgi:hypothetical protein